MDHIEMLACYHSWVLPSTSFVSSRHEGVSMRIFLVLTILLSTFTFAQPANSGSGNEMPDQVDKSLDPCNDFFQYACSKWLKANPIPSDQAGWGTFNKLAIWNVAAIHSTLEDAAKPTASRNAADQKAGDHYAS